MSVPQDPQVLLISDNDGVAGQIHVALATPNTGPFYVRWLRHLSAGIECLGERNIAAVLLDLSLFDSSGIDTFKRVFQAAPEVPILILGGDDQEALAVQAVALGAQDYLLPQHLNGYALPRALRNAIERKYVEDALYIERERALVTLNSIGDAVLCTDILGNISYLNLVAETMTGWSREEAIGQPLATIFNIIDGDTRLTCQDPLQMAIQQNRSVGLTIGCILVRRDGFESTIEDSASPIHDRAGRVIGAVIVFHDVTAARAMSQQMTYAAQHDVLTNLPNRSLFNNRIAHAIALAQRQKESLAVMFVDLDNFKYINDFLGHAAGDKLLQSVSQRLSASLRVTDTLSRQGGDEFIILLSHINNAEDAAASAQRLLLSLDPPHAVPGRNLNVHASIGISVYPHDGDNAETLIHNADTAMYVAKASGRNTFKFFKEAMNVEALARLTLASSLRDAIENQEFVLHYQPKVSLATGSITGVEALIRWQHPDRGLVVPVEFVPMAETSGLIVEIGRWALREACRQASTWQAAGFRKLPIAVNVSAIQLHNESFIAAVRSILAETGLAGQHLELELTESVLMSNVEYTVSILQELKALGIRVAIDDFGTGYSSLSYLRQFPVDVLKIDRSFVHEISSASNDPIIVNDIIKMGKSLKYLVVAEGIETREQRSYLEALNCPEGQGYLFSRPLPAVEFGQLLQSGIHAHAGDC